MKEKILKLLTQADGYIINYGYVLTCYWEEDDQYIVFREPCANETISYIFFIPDLEKATFEHGSYYLIEKTLGPLKVDFLEFEYLN